jgi:hypothetical protein
LLEMTSLGMQNHPYCLICKFRWRSFCSISVSFNIVYLLLDLRLATRLLWL